MEPIVQFLFRAQLVISSVVGAVTLSMSLFEMPETQLVIGTFFGIANLVVIIEIYGKLGWDYRAMNSDD